MSHARYEELLAVYPDLAPREREEVDLHLGTCAACAALLADYQALRRTLQGRPSPQPSDRLRQGFADAVARAQAEDRRGGPWARLMHAALALGNAASWAAVGAVAVLLLVGLAITGPELARRAWPATLTPAPAASDQWVSGHLTVQGQGTYTYRLLIPPDWAGRYEVSERDNTVSFSYTVPADVRGLLATLTPTPGLAKPNPSEMLFWISILTDAQWEAAQREPGPGSVIGTLDGVVIVRGSAIANSYSAFPNEPWPQVADEFQRMAGQVPAILESLEVTPRSAAEGTPTPAASPPSLSLGAPRWLGRGHIVDACFTPDGRLLAIGWGHGVSLWSAEAGAERWWRPTEACLIAVDVDPQGQAVAAWLQDGSVAVFDVATGDARRFEGAAPDVYWGDIAWSPGGERIAFQGIGPGRGSPIYLLDPTSGAVATVPESRIESGTRPYLAWSPDGERITQARLGGCSTLIDVQTGEVQLTLQSGDTCYSPWVLAWSPDGRAIAAVQGGRLDLLDGQSGQPLRSLEGRPSGLPAPNSGHVLVFSADGRYIAGRGGAAPHPVGWTPLTVWDVATGQVLGQIEGQREREDRPAAAFDGDSVISLYATGEITRWPVGAPETQETTIARLPALAPERWLAWSADGSKLAAAGRGGLAVWDTATGAPLASFGPGFTVPALSADGTLLAMTDTERREEVIYDLATGAVVHRLPGASPILQGAAFSPDGRLLAYGAGNRALVAEVATGRVLAELEGYPEGQDIARVVWAPDSSALVVASGRPSTDEARPVILWQRNGDGSFREAFRTQSVRTSYPDKPIALFSPGGALVALEDMPSFDAGQMTIPVFDRTSGRVILTLQDYELAAWTSDEVLLTPEAAGYGRLTRWSLPSGEKTVGQGIGHNALAYAPAGAYYATADGSGRRIAVQDWATGQVVCRVAHGAGVSRVSWSPDGRKVASLGSNGTIVVWTDVSAWPTYEDAEQRYRLRYPAGAAITADQSGQTTFTVTDHQTTYTVRVGKREAPVGTDGYIIQPASSLATIRQNPGLSDWSEIQELTINGVPAALVAYSYSDPGQEPCSTQRAQQAHLIAGKELYMLTFKVTGPGQCDATAVPWFEQMLHSFEPY